MSINTTRLASVIFDGGHKITQQQYASLCEVIEADRFTLNSYVMKYKLKESFLNKVAFRLDDGSAVLVSEAFVCRLNALNIEPHQLEVYMASNYANFKRISEIITSESQTNETYN